MKKRRTLAGVMAAALVMGSLTLPENIGGLDFGTLFAQAAEVVDSGTCGDNLTWVLDEEGTLTISGTGEMEYDETSNWSDLSESIVSVVIESGATNICNGAFYGCTSLTSITIPSSVEYIWDAAFRDCTNLTTVVFSEGISELGWGVFQGCTSLVSIELPESMTTIGQYSFADCTSLSDITIGSNMITIEAAVFENTAYYADDDNWEDGVLYLNTYLLDADVDVINGTYEIKEGTTVIADDSFANCTGLTSVIIPDSVMTIGGGAFYNCTNLTNVDMGEGVIYINSGYFYGAFFGCCSLTSIDIPDSVTYIGYGAFCSCTSLDDITIGSGITCINDEAFDDTAYYADESNWEDGVLYLDNYLLSAKGDELEGNYIIKDGTTLIAADAFYWCEKLTGITIPDSVKYIGNSAFWYSTSLSDISIGSGVVEIGSSAFYNTAFYNDENNWEDGVLYLESYLLEVDSNVLEGAYSVKDGTTLIADYAFNGSWDAEYTGSAGLTSVIIPDSVTYIGKYAFYNCTSLNNITIGSGVTTIGWGAFYKCINLTSVELGEAVTSIGYGAFGFCTSLADVYYAGSEKEWNDIFIDNGNNSLLNATIHFAKASYEDGDANLDGFIDYLDAMTVLRADAELIELTDDQISAADVNGDGSVDSLDAIMILRYDAGLIESF